MNRENHPPQAIESAAARGDLSPAAGPRYWRSLEELAGDPEVREWLEREFPAGIPGSGPGEDGALGRREFLRLMGAALALAGLTGCTRQPEEKIVPYVQAPEQLVPGKPLYFATAMPIGGCARGVLVESHLGRPTKVEGNPLHPDSLGATDAWAQASVLELYDPDRAQVVTRAGRISTWVAFLAALNGELEAQAAKRGAGLRVLTGSVGSPTLGAQLRALLEKFPEARWHQYEPCNRDAARAGSLLAFGEHLEPLHRFADADAVLALDADFLCWGPGSLRHAREFTARRKVRGGRAELNRLYAIESAPSPTGAMADHRLPLGAADVGVLARAVAAGLSVEGVQSPAALPAGVPPGWIDAVVRDLRSRRGRSLVLAGDWQPAAVHALAHAINHRLGSFDGTAAFIPPPQESPADHGASLRELTADLDAGRVDLLVILGGNPVYDAPADLQFAAAMLKARKRIHLALHEDETSALCDWHVPRAHYLESWSDARASDGTAGIIQPLIAPLYGGKSPHELLAALLGEPESSGYEIVREFWKGRAPAGDFEAFWQTALHDGVIAGTAFATRRPEVRSGALAEALRAADAAQAPPGESFEILFRPDPSLLDGRFSNNAWLQELPRPLTKLTWDNAAMMNPADAGRLGLRSGDLVDLRWRGREVPAPVWILPGQPRGSVTAHLGYGRTQTGRVGKGAGFNAYTLRRSDSPWGGPGLEVRPAGGRRNLATTQHHHAMEGRDLVRSGSLEELGRRPGAAEGSAESAGASAGHGTGHGGGHASFYPDHPPADHAWGMVIDLGSCTGCGACITACQSENNIPVVGKDEVMRGREMHWLRVDHYHQGDPENPETVNQPVPCMHCENAPCEVVCPVAATAHSAEGLNDMVYNRCVGTRYCSNNCPYKVRRFNFYQYSDLITPSLKLMRNPDVTVRNRGVMEKCTYCVQRINAARIEARKEDRKIRDGEVVTACQSVCPAQAIVFGDISDPESAVAKLRAEPLHYSLLDELNVRPRTTYLARPRNPNPEIAAG